MASLRDEEDYQSSSASSSSSETDDGVAEDSDFEGETISSERASVTQQAKGSLKAKSASDEYVRHAYHVFVGVLKMFKTRGGYDVDGLLESIKGLKDPTLFQAAILSPQFVNPLRDILAGMYTKRTFPSIRVMMSLLIRNPDGHFTAVFFAERKASQVSKKLMGLFFSAIAELKSSKFKVSEVVFVAPVSLSHESEASRRSISSLYFTQVFIDEEIIAPPTECIFSPKIRILTAQESKDFFTQESASMITPARMQQISHVDTLLKYLGARRHRVVEIIRPPLITSNLVQDNLTYAWIF